LCARAAREKRAFVTAAGSEERAVDTKFRGEPSSVNLTEATLGSRVRCALRVSESDAPRRASTHAK
jgi:hypothetical protein